MIIDIENVINFVPFFGIACFKEHNKIFIDSITLQPIGWPIGIECVYKTNCKAIGETDDIKVKKNIC